MAIFPIRLFGDPILRQRALDVATVDDGVRKLMSDMKETMNVAPGVGLAANQIGVARRVFVWQYEGDEGAIANPRITQSRGRVEEEEACLSLPGLAYPVVRADWVAIEGVDESGEIIKMERQGWVARIFQHELDHLDGVLFIDHLTPDLQKEARRRLREQALSGGPPPKPASSF